MKRNEIVDIIKASNLVAIQEARKGYVKLALDQTPPLSPLVITESHLVTYIQAQQDMIKAGWRKLDR